MPASSRVEFLSASIVAFTSGCGEIKRSGTGIGGSFSSSVDWGFGPAEKNGLFLISIISSR
jgi:hypothetical protein